MFYKHVGNNINKNLKARYTQLDNHSMSMHLYNSYVVLDKIHVSGLSESIPNLKKRPLLSIPVQNALPTNIHVDEKNLKHNFTLVDYLKYFHEN